MQSPQFVQFISSGRVFISQTFRHLSQSLQASVLYILNTENRLISSSRPPVGHAKRHHRLPTINPPATIASTTMVRTSQ